MMRNCKTLVYLLTILPFVTSGAADNDWSVYLGDKASSQYSELDQITPENVNRLKVAWVYNSGGATADNRSQIQCNPLIVDGVLFGTSPQIELFALNAATGKELWRYDPFGVGESKSSLGVNRGLVYWKKGKDERILMGAGNYLHAINAKTGKVIPSFGDKGRINLLKGLGREVDDLYFLSNTPGVIYDDLIILGGRLNEALPAPPGHIRAYNVITGEQVWRFNTIPHPGEYGYESWPKDGYLKSGGANVWTGMAVDEERGLVYCPTGSASADFYGGDRLGQNLFANTLLCLDARTGKRVWHFQFVHHDLWDRDLPTPPNLLTIKRDGKEIPAVSQSTKSGHVFVFNRETGEPLFPIEERPYPSSDLVGEQAWPTQPLPTKPEPFARQVLGYDLLNDLFPDQRKELQDRFIRLRPHMPFTPPSVQGTLIFPGFDGAAEWGGQAVDPNGILYVNSNEMPWILTMVNAAGGATNGERVFLQMCSACHGQDRLGSENQGTTIPPLTLEKLAEKQLDPAAVTEKIKKGAGIMPSFGFLAEKDLDAVIKYLFEEAESGSVDRQSGQTTIATSYGHTGYNKWKTANDYPAVKPPWGTLNAIDLNTGEYVWKTTLGEFEELTAQGIPPTGTENYGGPVITAGGVLFIGASLDEHFRAFDMSTGKELFKSKLPAAGYATPATYAVNGKQYIVIACGGGKLGTQSGDAYVAFSLP
ncbi:MAG: PQQ-binding-like beta-propeller repeat protein [Verrucomicrobia bacterium]|nr:PQQ-binding-like beta-propeller repeat protein [Verrucomicrobiota bacterium]